MPSIAEVLMLPYLVTKKYLVKSNVVPVAQTTEDRAGADLSAGL